MIRRLLAITAICVIALAEQRRFELAGQILPEGIAAVTVHATATPFSASTVTDARGRFRFRELAPGAYTLTAIQPNRGEVRRTVEIGASFADRKGRVAVTLQTHESGAPGTRGSVVSARELALPERARKLYEQAQKQLSRRDVAGALASLQQAVGIAPRFAAAWNNMGTIAYQSRSYLRAEECFREALSADPSAYEPLVNLGGVLINLMKIDEALKYNLRAVLAQPEEPLANSQLGMSYLYAGSLELGKKYLLAAKKLDPAHFSHPQLLLARIYISEKNTTAAALELEEFLSYHPDSPEADGVRELLTKVRGTALR